MNPQTPSYARSSIFAFDPGQDAERLIEDCQSWGIGELILHPGFFAKPGMETLMQDRGMSLWLNLPVFYNPGYLETQPDHYALTNQGRRAIHEWCHFVCPTAPGYVDGLIEEYRALVTRLKPARISLDFIRTFVFWELVALDGGRDAIEDGCYCPRCLAEFARETGTDLPQDNPVAFLRGPASEAWGRWKARRIHAVASRFVAMLREACPRAQLLIKLVPWRESELGGAILGAAGQDIPALASLVDVTIPMAFSHILGRDLAWKESLLAHMREQTGKPVGCYVQTNPLFRDEEIPVGQVAAELEAALSGGYGAIPIFWYEQLAQSSAVIETIRSILKQNP